MTTDDPTTETAGTAAVDADAPAPRRRSRLIAGLALLASAAVLASGLAALLRSGDDDAAAFARGRDQALVAGTDAVVTLNSLDSASLTQGLARWKAVTTGSLHQDLVKLGSTDRKALSAVGSKSTGTVLRSGLTRLDLRAGTAQAIFLVEVKVRDGDGQTSTKRNRLQGDLQREDGTWRLSSLTPITVGASS